MLISGELYQALREGGAHDENAMSAAAVLADHEMRLRKLEEMFSWALRGAALFGASAVMAMIAAAITR